PTPACFHPKTLQTYVFYRSAYTTWDGGGEVRPLTGVGTLNLETGRVTPVEHSYPSSEPPRPPGRKDMPWGVFATIGDETQALSCSDDWLFSNHQGTLGGLRWADRRCVTWFGRRDTYGGFYGP